ncbi:MAG: LysR substrate-binding domain-containing protein [Roseovarius sp.]
MKRQLPPLNAIRVFEACARKGGFVAAAEELGVTPAAISLQVRKLELHYQTELFRRLSSGVELTELGAAIHAECISALDHLERTNDLVTANEVRKRRVVSCINSVAHRWLGPRLGRLSKDQPDLWIELRAQADPVDFEDARVDIRLTYGTHLYPHYITHPLYRDAVAPVCTPEFAREHGLLDGEIGGLPDELLIETRWSPSFWAYPSWEDWFAEAGAQRSSPSSTGHCVDTPALATDMALRGLGVALAQLSLSEDELESGRLIRLFDPIHLMPKPYAIVLPRSERRRRVLARLIDWLLAEGQRTEQGILDLQAKKY